MAGKDGGAAAAAASSGDSFEWFGSLQDENSSVRAQLISSAAVMTPLLMVGWAHKRNYSVKLFKLTYKYFGVPGFLALPVVSVAFEKMVSVTFLRSCGPQSMPVQRPPCCAEGCSHRAACRDRLGSRSGDWAAQRVRCERRWS